MREPAKRVVTLLAQTRAHVDGTGEDLRQGDASDLVEFAGRVCYQSFDRPNPATATPETYIANLIKVGHHSVLEHGTVTLRMQGVSRAFTHELVRHRHFSFSQVSQRYVTADKMGWVCPPAYRRDTSKRIMVGSQFESALALYQQLVGEAGNGAVSLKKLREAARSVLPNCTATDIVVTGNWRQWRHFLQLRATPAADAEACEVAIDVYSVLMQAYGGPALLQDADVVFGLDLSASHLTWRTGDAI